MTPRTGCSARLIPCLLLIAGALIVLTPHHARAADDAGDTELTRLRALATTAQQTTPDANTAQAQWRTFLAQSADFAQKNSTIEIWTLRATAAAAINDSAAGKEAAAKLAELGSLTKNDKPLVDLMARLVLKGWLTLPSAAPPARKSKKTPAAAADTEAPTPEATVKTILSLFNKAYGRDYETSDRREQYYRHCRYDPATHELSYQVRTTRVNKNFRVIDERITLTIPVPLITRIATIQNRWGKGLRIETLAEQIRADTTPPQKNLSSVNIYFNTAPDSDPATTKQGPPLLLQALLSLRTSATLQLSANPAPQPPAQK